MGILDLLTKGAGPADPNSPQYGDVPIGYRLGLLGNILASAAQGQAPNPAGFAIMAKMKEDAAAQRKQNHAMELASKYLDKRPDLKPLVESGAMSIADIIKMDREDQTTQQNHDWWKEQEQYKADHDPNAAWLKGLMGDGSAPPAPAGPPEITDTSTSSAPMTAPPVPGATPAPAAAPAPAPGVPTPPGATTPPMPPVPGDTANGAVAPITARLRVMLKDPNLNDNEASYIAQTVRSPDDLRAAYNTILTNRTEQAKVAAEQQKRDDAAAEKDKKEQGAKNMAQAERMTAVSALDQSIKALDADGAPAAGVGAIWSSIPTTNAGILASNLTTLKSFISIDKMAEMRANSPTGSTGMGQVSNFEERMLSSSAGALDQSLPEETLRANLNTVRTKIVAFNTPSTEDPTKSVMTVDCEKLASNPTPESIAKFEKKYGEGSSSVVTGDTTSAEDRPADAPATTSEDDAIVQHYLNPQPGN
jgi:hypothetical protein